MKRNRKWLLLGLGASLLFCLALSDGTIYNLGVLRTVFLDLAGTASFTGDALTIANGNTDDFTMNKTGTTGDFIIKSTDTASNTSDLILDSDSSTGPIFKQSGVIKGQFTGTSPPLGPTTAFAVGELFINGTPQVLNAANLIITKNSTDYSEPTSVVITTHSVTGNPNAKFTLDSYTSQVSSLRMQGVYEYPTGNIASAGPALELFSTPATSPGGSYIAGDAGLQSDDPLAFRNSNSAEAIAKFIRGTTTEWTIDASGNWVDSAGGNLVDTVDVAAHTHVGGGSNGAALGTDSVGTTQITGSLCLGSVDSLLVNPNTAGDMFAPWANTDNTFVTATEADSQGWYGGPFTAHSLRVKVSTAPGVGKSWAILLRDDSANTTLTCTIADANTTCADTTNFPSISAGSVLNWKVTASGTPTATTNMFISACTGQ